MSAREKTSDPPDVGTILWEADRRSAVDLDPGELRVWQAAADYVADVWPLDDDGDQLAAEEHAELLELRSLESVVLNIFGADSSDEGLDEKIRARLAAERAEGEKDATIPSRASTAERKAMRLLLERRLAVLRRDDRGELEGLIVATCRGDSGVYHLGYDPRGRGKWRCTCPELRGECSHLTALRMVVA